MFLIHKLCAGIVHRPLPELPRSGRGRALYTVDWFLNGKPVLRSHDNPQLSIRGGCHC